MTFKTEVIFFVCNRDFHATFAKSWTAYAMELEMHEDMWVQIKRAQKVLDPLETDLSKTKRTLCLRFYVRMKLQQTSTLYTGSAFIF